MRILKEKGSAVIGVVLILGILLMLVVVFLYIKASDTSEKIYQNMVDEVSNQDDDKYGVGAIPDESLTDEEEFEAGKKPKPIIYVYPVLKNK
jgi:hypothetical protein